MLHKHYHTNTHTHTLRQHMPNFLQNSLHFIYIPPPGPTHIHILAKISTHPGHHLFNLLPSGRRYRAMFAKSRCHKDSFFPQAVTLLNTER